MKFKYVGNDTPFLTKGKDYECRPNFTWSELSVLCNDGEERIFNINFFRICTVEPSTAQL